MGGARLRGFAPGVAFDAVASANVNLDQKLTTLTGAFGALGLWGGVFGDGGIAKMQQLLAADGSHAFVDLGVGIRLRGRFYDRDVDFRLEAPLATNDPIGGSGLQSPGSLRWTFDWR